MLVNATAPAIKAAAPPRVTRTREIEQIEFGIQASIAENVFDVFKPLKFEPGHPSLYLFAKRDTLFSVEKHPTGKLLLIKELSEVSASNQDQVNALNAEAEALQDLRGCKHIVQIEMDEYGNFFRNNKLVMEYIQGATLKNLYSSPIDPLKALFITSLLLKALKEAHFRQFIHRDIKGSNIMVALDGSIKLIDFGISKRRFRNVSEKLGAIGGTLEYLAPENILEPNLTAAPQLDLYSTGILLFELLEGRPPFDFDGDIQKLSDFIIHQEEYPFIFEKTPGRLQPFIRKMTDKNSRLRPVNAAVSLQEVIALFEQQIDVNPDAAIK